MSDTNVLRFECKEPEYVLKRNGTKVKFDSEKIVNAIKAAGLETKEFSDAEARHLAFSDVKVLTRRYDQDVPDIEKIQDIVEQVLISENYFQTARAYILYRAKRGEARKDKKKMVDVVLAVNEYLDKLDWRVNANANQGYSLGGMILNISGTMVATYWLKRVYP